MAKSGVVYDPTSKTSDPEGSSAQHYPFGIVWSRLELARVVGSNPESSGVVVWGHLEPMSSGITRSCPDSSGIIWSHLDSFELVPSHPESSGVNVFWNWRRSESSGVVWSRCLLELVSFGVIRSHQESSEVDAFLSWSRLMS